MQNTSKSKALKTKSGNQIIIKPKEYIVPKPNNPKFNNQLKTSQKGYIV